MSTNFYIRSNMCECCNRYDEEHIGKASFGEDFTIKHHKDKYHSFEEYKIYIKE